MTPEREKIIRWYWMVYKDAWHETIGDEYKVRVMPEGRYADNVMPIKPGWDMLTFTRKRDLGETRIECEGIVVETYW